MTTIRGRLPDENNPDRQQALLEFMYEREQLVLRALETIKFEGAVRPPRARVEREWLLSKLDPDVPQVVRESDQCLEEPQGRRRRRD